MTTSRHEPGNVIAGRYRLQQLLGEGSMGAVWRAEHLTLKSPVALKFINAAHAADADALPRFMLEAQSAAALRSTNIVQVFDFGVEDGSPFIAMELLAGESLGDRLDREKSLSLTETFRILGEAARAVQYAHDAGVVHRDLKPDNIFIVREGNVEVTKVLDFGIAKVNRSGLDATEGRRTATGVLVGTPYYVSPEQARGNRAVDHRSDLWALGVIAFECVMGSRPFTADGLGELLIGICTGPHPVPSTRRSVPRGFDEWMARCLAKDPGARYPSATAMFDALRLIVTSSAPADTLLAERDGVSPMTTGGESHGLLGGTDTGAGTTERSFASSARPTRRSTRGPWIALAAAVGVGAALVTGAVSLWKRPSSPAAAMATATEPGAAQQFPAKVSASTTQNARGQIPQVTVSDASTRADAQKPDAGSNATDDRTARDARVQRERAIAAPPVSARPPAGPASTASARSPSSRAATSPRTAPAGSSVASPPQAPPASTARSGAALFDDRL